MVAIGPSGLAGVQAAKAVNPNLIALMSHEGAQWTPLPFPAVTYGGTWEGFAGATDNVVDGNAGNAGVLRAFSNYWDLLYEADGSQVNAWGQNNGHGLWNLANYGLSIGIESTWQALARFILYRLKQNRLYRDSVWDGFYSDNWMSVAMGGYGFSGQLVDSDRNGVQDTNSVLFGRWGNGLNSLGKYLRDNLPGMIVGGNVITKFDPREGTWVVNHADRDGWHKYANFAEIENGEDYLYSNAQAQKIIDVLTSTDSSVDGPTGSSRLGWLNYPDLYSQERYAAFFFQLEDDAGNYLAQPANYNTPSVYKQEVYYRPARKGLALACCAGAYYWPLFVQQHSSRLFYDDEMLGGTGVSQRNWMGQPLAAATNPVSGVFMRQFTSGLAIVNVTGTAQAVTVPGGANVWRKIAGTASHNNGATVTTSTFTIPAHDGRLLVRV